MSDTLFHSFGLLNPWNLLKTNVGTYAVWFNIFLCFMESSNCIELAPNETITLGYLHHFVSHTIGILNLELEIMKFIFSITEASVQAQKLTKTPSTFPDSEV